MSLNLATGGLTGDAAGDTFSSIENVFGTAFADIIAGNAVANVIDGGDGNDMLFGMAGDDVIVGGWGADTLRGGAGNDRLVGGLGGINIMTGDDAGGFGHDTFVVDPFLDFSADIITDFQRGLDELEVGVVAGDFGADGHLMIGAGDWSTFESREHVLESMQNTGEKYIFNVQDHTLYMVGHFFADALEPIAVLEGVNSLSEADLI